MKNTISWPRINDLVTLLRIVLTPIFLICFYIQNTYSKKIGIGLFVLLCLSDILDGYLARKFKIESKIGKILDPLADKILSLSALILLIDLRQINSNEIWMIYIVFFREIIATGIRSSSKIIANGSSKTGKGKTFIINLSILFFLINTTFQQKNYILHQIASSMLFISMILGLVSLIRYLIKAYKELNDDK